MTTKKHISQNIAVDESTATQILETSKPGTYGVWCARQVIDGETKDWEQIYLETNGDPAIAPHADYGDELDLWLVTAGITLEELEEAIGETYRQWCMSEAENLTCQLCGESNYIDDHDACGACVGNVFCPNCGAEIDSVTGDRGDMCGKCTFCRGEI